MIDLEKNACFAIAGIVILVGLALYLGYDGVLFLTAIGIISGLGGYPVLKEIKQAYQNIGEAVGEQAQKKGIL